MQKLTIDSLSPKLQLPLPQNIAIWQAPISIRGTVRAYDIWLAAPRGPVGQDWEPFAGALECLGDVVKVANGVLTLSPEPAVSLENSEHLKRLINPDDPLQELAIPSPSVRRLNEQQPSGPDFWTSLTSAPFFLGTHKNAALKDKKEPPPGLLVNACTICCGAGVAGVAVNAGKSSIGETNTKGQCSLPNVVETECLKCEVSHTAMGIVPHKISMNGPTELPLFFKSKVYVYVVDGNEGSLGPKLVYLTAHVSQVPKNAKPFQGRVTTDVGDVPLPEPPSTGALPIELPPEQVPGKVCPIGALTFLPAQAGFKWCPLGTSNWPPPRESCGMQSLLSEGAILLGSLKPFATIKHISGQEYVFPLDEFATVGAAKAHLAKELDVSMGNLKVGLKDGVALKDDIPTTYGLALQVLCYLTVRITFGSSDVGMPDVLIKAEGHEKKYKTDPNGMVEILAGCGTQNLVLSHPCFGEEKTSVELTEHQQKWSHATDVTLYAYVTDPEVKKPVSAIEVWLCAQRGQIPAAARKWEGKVSVPPEQLVNVVIGDKSAAITITNKEDASATGELPVSWLSLDCKEDGYDWFSKEEKLMDTKAIWAEIIQMPINVGVLKPSIKVTNCDGQELSVPVDEATSGLGVRTYLAKKTGCST
jgi:hypothetical protein